MKREFLLPYGMCCVDIDIQFKPMSAPTPEETLILMRYQQRLKYTAMKFGKLLEKRLNKNLTHA